MSLIWKGDFAGLPGKVVLASPMVCANTAKGDNKLYSDAKGVVPSLDLRFASQKNLNDYMTGTPLVDHQRSMSGSNLSSGTFVNSSGLIETAKVNLVSYSQEFENSSYYNTANITIMQPTTDSAAPDGTFTARYISGASNGRVTIPSSNFTSQSGRRKSIYLRAVSGSPVVNALTAANTDPNPVTLSSTEWQRFEVDTPSSEVGGTTFVVDFRGSSTTTEVYAWGLQIEDGSAATTYIPTTDLPSAAPRFDHDPDTLESLGLLLEESRENLVTYSDFDPLGWTPGGGGGTAPTVTWTGETDPSGGTDAATITFQGTATNQQVTAVVPAFVIGTVYTYSVYARVPSGTYDFILYINDGTVQSKNVTATTEWERFDFVFTAASNNPTASVRIRAVSPAAGDELIVWGAQLEEGSFPTSLIPTSGTALTRNADVASITGANFSSWYNQSEGTTYLDFSRPFAPVSSKYWYSFSGSNVITQRHSVYQPANLAVVATTNDGTPQATLSIAGSFSNKHAYAYKLNDYAACVDGGTVSTQATATVPSIEKLNIGSFGNGFEQPNGTISRLTYFPDRLPDATLQAITAP